MEIFTDMMSAFWMILSLCLGALVVIRLMGNRTVGQLSPFDFVIMVGMGDIIVTTAMDKNQTVFAGMGGLLSLLILQQVLGYLSLKNTFLRRIFEGVPVVLIRNGQILKESFRKTRFNYDDLRQELHKMGMDMTEVKDIKLARLESCGVLTIIKNQDLEPVSKRDVKNYFEDMIGNPLGETGVEWQKLQVMMKEVHLIAEYIKEKR